MKKSLLVISPLILSLLVIGQSQAQGFSGLNDQVCYSTDAAQSAYCTETASGGSNKISGSDGLLLTVVDIISFIGGAAAVIAIIIAGFRLVLSSGDSNNVSGARNMIIYALIGVVVILASQGIIRFVLGKL